MVQVLSHLSSCASRFVFLYSFILHLGMILFQPCANICGVMMHRAAQISIRVCHKTWKELKTVGNISWISLICKWLHLSQFLVSSTSSKQRRPKAEIKWITLGDPYSSMSNNKCCLCNLPHQLVPWNIPGCISATHICLSQ